MWWAKCQETMHFVLVFFKERKCRSYNQTTKTVSNKSKSTKLRAWTTFPYILVNFFSKLFAHFEDALVGVSFISLCTKEEGVWHSDTDDVFKHTDVEWAALEAMTQYKEMHTFIICIKVGGVDFCFKLLICFDLKVICYSTRAWLFHEALFKDERCILLELICFSLLFTWVIHHNINLLNRLKLCPIHLSIHLYNLSSLFRNHIIQLSSEVFRWEAEILCKYNMS